MRMQQLGRLAVISGMALGFTRLCLAGDDLTMTKKITANGANISAQTLIQGSRERTTMDMGTGAPMATVHQCDLKRSLTVNDAQKTYMVKPDLEEPDNSKAAAALLGAAPAPQQGGTVTYSSTVKDTGERKQMHGYTARHLKTTVVTQPSENACSKAKQKYEIDGWYVDIKDHASCQHFSPYAGSDAQGCHDRVVLKQTGTAKPGVAVQETITLTNGDEPPVVISTEVTELKKAPLAPELFDLPADYKEVSTTAELYGAPSMPQQTAQAGANVPPAAYAPPQQPQFPQRGNTPSVAQMMNPATQMAMQQQVMAQARQTGMAPTGMSPMNSVMAGMGGMSPMGGAGAPQGAAQVAAPQALGPKAAGKIRIGVAPPDAQVGQGNNAGADYSTPIRNAVVALMSGPAVEIAALDSHVPVQL